MPTPSTPPPAPLPVDAAAFTEAFDAVRAELDAIPDDALVLMNFDLSRAVLACLTALPALRALRDEIADHLPRFDLARFDRLATYARAAALADARYHAALAPPEPLAAIYPAASAHRDALLRAAAALAIHDVLPAARIAAMRKTGSGYRNTANQLLTVAEMLRSVWARIDGHTFLTPADLDHAMTLANRLLVALARRDQTDPRVTAAALTRRRAATALVRAYEEARRAVAYLRWYQADVDQLAPSLYIRVTRKRDPAAPPAAPSEPPADPDT